MEWLVKPRLINWLKQFTTKTQAFTLEYNLNKEQSCMQKHVCKIWTFFLLSERFFSPHCEWNFIPIEPHVTLLSFGCLYLWILEINSKQCFNTQHGFSIFNLRWLPRFVCLVYSLRSNILVESYSATTELLRKELSGH